MISSITIDFKIKCRAKGCKNIHKFDHIPVKDFNCQCGYILIKDGLIYPADKKEK